MTRATQGLTQLSQRSKAGLTSLCMVDVVLQM